MYYLLHEGRHKSIRFTLDRFNFTAGLVNMKYLDGSNTTNRILDVLDEKRPKIICIDELDKMPRQFQEKLILWKVDILKWTR
jgi:hypothetical protein